MTARGPDWFTDAYHLSPAPKALLTIVEGEHTLGGVAGEKVAETTDEDATRVALVVDAVSAYPREALGGDGSAWTAPRDDAASSGTYSIHRK
ncbi:MAG: hypothetical protein QM638_05730 [Nocardioides sp.]|uniref:hypothetical protein n=1 Tax=Nocardioides sp. TaxID=35761 RepID=UPI0039E4463E